MLLKQKDVNLSAAHNEGLTVKAGRIQTVPPDERLSPQEGGREGYHTTLGKPPPLEAGYYQKHDRNSKYVMPSGQETIIDLSSLRREPTRIGVFDG